MNVEVKVQCDCGTRYKFDVEPLHNRMPQKVSCPHCGVDGTPAANAVLREKLGVGTRKSSSPALRAPSPPSDGGEGRGEEVHGQGDRFGLGLAGAASAAVVAMLAWFFLIKVTGHSLGFAAWGVGLLVGLGARALGREGTRRLGLAAGACAFVAILGGQMLAAQSHAGNLKAGFSGGSLGWLTLLWLLMAVLSAFKLAASRAR